MKKNGELFSISVIFYKGSYEYEIVISKNIKVIDRMNVLEQINNYNKMYYRMAFFLENNDLYGLRSYERYDGNPQSFLNNVVNLLNILTSTNI